MQEDDLALLIFANSHCIYAQVWQFFCHSRQFMIMGGEECAGCRNIVQVFDNCPRNSQAIVGARAPADFIQDNEAMPRGMVQDGSGFLHLHHERAFAGRNVIFSANARKNAIYHPNARTPGRHKAADLR